MAAEARDHQTTTTGLTPVVTALLTSPILTVRKISKQRSCWRLNIWSRFRSKDGLCYWVIGWQSRTSFPIIQRGDPKDRREKFNFCVKLNFFTSEIYNYSSPTCSSERGTRGTVRYSPRPGMRKPAVHEGGLNSPASIPVTHSSSFRRKGAVDWSPYSMCS